MIIVEQWVKDSSKEERTAHLDLTSPCVERGGNSTVHRGVLAEYLGTNFPSKVDLCHACHNDKCSNAMHLYWGTRKENIQDAKENGTWKSPWDNLVAKYGLEQASKMNARFNNKNGKGNKGKLKTEKHRQNISKALKK